MKRYNAIKLGILTLVIVVVIIFRYMYIPEQPLSSELYEIPFHIDRKTSRASNSVSGVPLTIYQSWQTNNVPTKMRENIFNLLKMNPEFDYYLYSDETSLEFIKSHFEQDVVDAFNTLKPGAYKSDLWRCCILYKLGGVYLDIKYCSVVPIYDIIKENPVIYTRDLDNNCINLNQVKIRTGIYNAFMVSPPNNPIFKASIDEIVYSCKHKLYRAGPLDITGPCHLSRIIENHDPSIDISKLPIYHDYEGILPWWLVSKQPCILYKGTIILKGYAEYRKEQSLFSKKEYYAVSWAKGTIYN